MTFALLPLSVTNYLAMLEILCFPWIFLSIILQVYCFCIFTKHHSFLRNADFWGEPRNLLVSMEFLCFRWIWQNSVLAS